MLRRTLFVGASALVLLYGGIAWPQDDKGYETLFQLLELRSAPHQLIITVVNSKLVDRSGADRVDEATAIASAVTEATATRPQFHDIEALYIDYVIRKEDRARIRSML